MIDPLRLLVVGLTWPPETFLARLLQGLAHQGVHITLAMSQQPNSKLDESWRNMHHLSWLNTPGWDQTALPLRLVRLVRWRAQAAWRVPDKKLNIITNRPRSFRDSLAAWYRLLPYLLQAQPGKPRRWDVIYFPWNSAAIEHLPLFDLGIPTVVSCRGSQVLTAPHNPKRQEMSDGLRKTFEKATAVHCVSENILAEAQQLGLDPAKARVIRPAVDAAFFTPTPVSQRNSASGGSLRVLATGSMSWVKGYEYALRAIYLLKQQNTPVQFNIIGDGPEKARILYTIQDLGLEENVHLLGKLPPEAVRQQLWQADAFLLSSLSEGISNAALEAMACGLPVVSADCGGMSEVIQDGVQGFLCPVREPERLAQALLQLQKDSALRQQMGASGRMRILQAFCLDQYIDIWHALLIHTTQSAIFLHEKPVHGLT